LELEIQRRVEVWYLEAALLEQGLIDEDHRRRHLALERQVDQLPVQFAGVDGLRIPLLEVELVSSGQAIEVTHGLPQPQALGLGVGEVGVRDVPQLA